MVFILKNTWWTSLKMKKIPWPPAWIYLSSRGESVTSLFYTTQSCKVEVAMTCFHLLFKVLDTGKNWRAEKWLQLFVGFRSSLQRYCDSHDWTRKKTLWMKSGKWVEKQDDNVSIHRAQGVTDSVWLRQWCEWNAVAFMVTYSIAQYFIMTLYVVVSVPHCMFH